MINDIQMSSSNTHWYKEKTINSPIGWRGRHQDITPSSLMILQNITGACWNDSIHTRGDSIHLDDNKHTSKAVNQEVIFLTIKWLATELKKTHKDLSPLFRMHRVSFRRSLYWRATGSSSGVAGLWQYLIIIKGPSVLSSLYWNQRHFIHQI